MGYSILLFQWATLWTKQSDNYHITGIYVSLTRLSESLGKHLCVHVLWINDMVLCTFGSKSDDDDDDDDDDEPTKELLACTTLQLCTCMYRKWKIVLWKLMLKAGLFSHQRQIQVLAKKQRYSCNPQWLNIARFSFHICHVYAHELKREFVTGSGLI